MRYLAIIAGVLALMASHAYADEPNIDTGGGFGAPAATLLQITSTGYLSSPVSAGDTQNMYYRGVSCMLAQTATLGTAPLTTMSIQGKDQTSGIYYTLGTSGQVSAGTVATSSTLLTVYPGQTAGTSSGPAGSAQVNAFLPKVWRVAVGIATSTTVTATVGCTLIR